MAEKDYIAMWFEARRPYGISDDIYWSWCDTRDNSVNWKSWRHANADGMSGFANIMRPMGYPCDPLPVCNETSVPGWREIIKAQREHPVKEAPKVVNWRKTYDTPVEFMPEFNILTREETAAVYAASKARRVSPGNLIFSALSRVIARELIEGDEPFYWFFPVNVRGATGIKTESFNQASGVYLLLDRHSTAEDWQSQMRTRLKSKEHWKSWKLANIGKYIGMPGVKLVYKMTSGKQFFVGSCSNLGAWPLADERNPEPDPHMQLVAAAPGSTNYPVASSMIEWNKRMALTLKLNSYICQSRELLRDLTDQWYEELKKDLSDV